MSKLFKDLGTNCGVAEPDYKTPTDVSAGQDFT